MQMERVTPLNSWADSTRETAPGSDDPYAAGPAVTVPYGWRLVRRRTSWALVPDRAPWAVLTWLISERRAGRSYQDLADDLQRRRVPAPPGTAGRWHKELVRTTIQKAAPDLAPTPRESPS